MHDPCLMCGGYGGRDLSGHVECRKQLDARAHEHPQRLSINELGDDEMTPFNLPDLINSEDVRMVEGRSGARFLLKSQHSLAIMSEFLRQQFERDLAPEPRVFCQVNLSHPARA